MGKGEAMRFAGTTVIITGQLLCVDGGWVMH
jgi:hypothetical protein